MEGDRNTRFFHYLVNNHKKNNYVKSIEIGDGLVLGNEQLRKETRITLIGFTRKSWVGDQSWLTSILRPWMNLVGSCSREFSEEEIFESLTLCKRDKILDGFNISFLQESWHIMKDILDFFWSYMKLSLL